MTQQLTKRSSVALPRELPVDWAERYIAKEFKVVALRECPVPSDLVCCDTPELAAKYWHLTIPSIPYFDPERECMVVLMFNTRRRVKGHQLLSIGTKDTLLVSSGEVFRAAIVASAAAIIVMHNHPSGVAIPSEADVKVTRELIQAGRMVKVEVLDHVIMGRATADRPKDYISLRELGYFFGADPESAIVAHRGALSISGIPGDLLTKQGQKRLNQCKGSLFVKVRARLVEEAMALVQCGDLACHGVNDYVNSAIRSAIWEGQKRLGLLGEQAVALSPEDRMAYSKRYHAQ